MRPTRRTCTASGSHRVRTTRSILFAHYETINYLMKKDVVGSTVNPTLELRMVDVGFTS